MERVRGARAMCRWIGQRIDVLQLRDDGAGHPCVMMSGSAFSCFDRT
jgi:hypothetical protein